MQWSVIFKKEMLEYARNIKWIWVPIVFFILGIIDQITTYYLPIIIESVGGLPEGAEFSIPQPHPADAMFMSFNEYNLLGFIILGLISMGLISGELKSGVYELVLSKPVKYHNYITAKWAGLTTLVLASTFIGLLGGWYYVNILFGELSFQLFLVSFLIYAVYLLFFITITVFVNTWFKRPGMVLFVSFLILIIISIVTNIFKHLLPWSPTQISSYVNNYLNSGNITGEMIGAIITTIVLIAILLFSSIFVLKKKEL